jgi:hypothetical protein
VAIAGVFWGTSTQTVNSGFLSQLAYLAGGAFGIAGLFGKSVPQGKVHGDRLAAAGLLGYIAIGAVVEPLAFVQDASRLLVALAWLIPVIGGGVVMTVRGSWLTALGCWAVLFSGSAALGYNVSHVDSGMGFLIRWLS